MTPRLKNPCQHIAGGRPDTGCDGSCRCRGHDGGAGRTTRPFGIALCQGFGDGAGQVHNLGLHTRHIGANLGQFDLGLHPSVVFRAGIPSFCVGMGAGTPLVYCGGEVNASAQIAAVVYALNAPSALQGHIAGSGPSFAPSSHQGGTVPISTLATKAFCLYVAQRQHDVGMGVAGLCVQRNVRDHAQTHKVLVHVPVKERNVLRMGKFDGECNLDLAGQLTVGPCLDGFDLVPQLWAVKNPSGGTVRRQDYAVCRFAFAGAVERTSPVRAQLNRMPAR